MGRSDGSIRLRPARMDDARFLFRLRNDPTTRAASFQTGELRYANHVAWLAACLNDTPRRTRLYIASLADGTPIGQVRFDDIGQSGDEAEISIVLAAAARGKGLATPVLLAALRTSASRRLTRVLARIRVGNERSVRAFQGAGFTLFGRQRRSPAPHVCLEWRR